MRNKAAGLATVFALAALALGRLMAAQGTPTTPLGPPTSYLSATDLAGNAISTNFYLTGGGALPLYVLAGSTKVIAFSVEAPGTDGDGVHFDGGAWLVGVIGGGGPFCLDIPYPWPTDGDGARCFVLTPRFFTPDDRVGLIAPLSVVVNNQPLVFHDWEVVDPQPGACRTGNMGIRPIPDDPSYRGQADTAFAEGVEARLALASPLGTPPAEVKVARFRAVYAPASPDVSAPLITVDAPRDCRQIPQGSAATISFGCRDLGTGVQSCTATPGYENGATIDTSTFGDYAFTVTALDAAGNARTRTIRYSVVDVHAPVAAPTMPAPNLHGWHKNDVTVAWNWSDAGGVGVDPAHCAPTTTSSGEGDNIVLTSTCRDLAGNQNSASVTLKVDKTPPQANIRISPNPVVQGTTPQVLSDWTDALSGFVSSGCGALPTNAPGSFNLACTGYDRAGNASPLQIPYTVVLANGEYLFWHAGDLSSTIDRIRADGTGRTSFPVRPNARLISANGTILYYSSVIDTVTYEGPGWRTDLDGENPYQILEDLTGIRALAASTSYIYFRNPVNLLKAYPDGQLLDGYWFYAPVVEMAADDTYVYAVVDAGIVRAHHDGSDATTLITVANGVRSLARTGDWIYWIDNGTGHIGRVKTDGSSLAENLIAVDANAIAASSNYVFWANRSETTIGRASLDGTGLQMSFVTNAGADIRHMTVGGAPAFDSTAPTIQLNSPLNAGLYTLNQLVTADYTCSDGVGGAGLESCAGTLPSGAAIDTSTYGTRTFTVTARDFSGNERVATSTYTVGYTFGGFAPPVDAAPTVNAGAAGKTYPIKFQLLQNGVPIGDLGAVASLTYLTTSCASFAGSPSDALEAEVTGNTSLRYDAASTSFIYNWKTPKAPGCYTLWLNLRSGQQFRLNFQLK